MKTFPPLPCHQRSDRVHLDVIPTEVVGVLGGCFVSDVGVGSVLRGGVVLGGGGWWFFWVLLFGGFFFFGGGGGGLCLGSVCVSFVVVVVWLLAGVSWGVVEGFGIVEVLLGNWLGQVGIEAGSFPVQALTKLSRCVSCGAGTGCWGRRTISLGRRWCVCCKRT